MNAVDMDSYQDVVDDLNEVYSEAQGADRVREAAFADIEALQQRAMELEAALLSAQRLLAALRIESGVSSILGEWQKDIYRFVEAQIHAALGAHSEHEEPELLPVLDIRKARECLVDFRERFIVFAQLAAAKDLFNREWVVFEPVSGAGVLIDDALKALGLAIGAPDAAPEPVPDAPAGDAEMPENPLDWLSELARKDD